MEEVFRPIRNYEELYKVSNFGNVFSVKKGNFLKVWQKQKELVAITTRTYLIVATEN